MRISKKLNIVIPVTTENHGQIYIHATPINRDIFEQFYSQLGNVFSQCFDGIGKAHLALSAPQLAYPALKRIAMDAGNWEGPTGVKQGLVNEIIRLTNVQICGENGWDNLPLDTVIKRQLLDEDEESEALSALVFFMSISLVAPKEMKVAFLEMAGSLRNWQLTPLDSTGYIAGLQISTKAETIQTPANP